MSEVKVTLNQTPTPSEQPAAKVQDNTVTDAQGRRIELAKPDILSQYDLVDALGDTAKNETYLRMVTPILYVKAIDGQPFYFQASKSGVRAAIKQLGEDGLNAVIDGMAQFFATPSELEFQASVKN